jgi:hypothetical protein
MNTTASGTSRLPSKERLEYMKIALEVILLIVLVPLAVISMLRNPSKALQHAKPV